MLQVRPGSVVIGGTVLRLRGYVFVPSRPASSALLQLTAEVEHKPMDEVLKAFAIAEQKAPDGTEYLHGMTYWLACGDHFDRSSRFQFQQKRWKNI
jgi:hypothetical protein